MEFSKVWAHKSLVPNSKDIVIRTQHGELKGYFLISKDDAIKLMETLSKITK